MSRSGNQCRTGLTDTRMHIGKSPQPLRVGDRLRVVAPSGLLRDPNVIESGIVRWEARGYRVERSPGVKGRWGYLAGSDDARRSEIRNALADPECRGLLCARGGFGGARLLENWHWPSCEPKWLVGFSDITSLLWSLAKQGICGVHGPVLTTFGLEPDWSAQRLFDWVEGRTPPSLRGTGWGGGRAIGHLLPANLTVATHLLGTDHEPNLAGSILALEDVTEAPYRIDRLLTHWRMAGRLAAVAGIALGRFSRCDAPPGIPSLGIEEVLRDRLADLGVPIVSGLPFGHEGVNAALPVGAMATLDGDNGTLAVTAHAGVAS